jgi:ABC-2 type transport system permease protein
MKTISISIFLFEFKHFYRSKYKVLALILFVFAGIYGIQIGKEKVAARQLELNKINQEESEKLAKIISWYDQGMKGPEDRPWIDINTPFWANWYTPTNLIKEHHPLSFLTIGQQDLYPFHKNISVWSAVYDADMIPEIANPERILLGNLDYSFTVIYLLPLLLMVLLHNIGGLEYDYGFDRLIRVHSAAKRRWIFNRSIFYFLLVLVTVFLLPFFYLPSINQNQIGDVYWYFIFLFFYAAFWTVLYLLVLLNTNSLLASTLKMTGLWLFLCILIPGAVHSIADYRYPLNFMGEFLNTSREEVNKLWELPSESLEKKLVDAYPEIKSTKLYNDTLKKEELISYSSSALANIMLKKVYTDIENQFEPKNSFIQSTYWFNPVGLMENKMNALAENGVQLAIDKKIELLIFQLWNGETMTKEKFLDNYNALQQE